MSSTIIGDVLAVKLKNGKVLPFALTAESNVRNWNNSYVWEWHNIHVGTHDNFMFDNAEQVKDTIKNWAGSGNVKYKNGGFITVKGMNKLLKKAFANPIPFAKGLFLVHYIQLSDDRMKAETVFFKPNSEEEFLAYMEDNKKRSINIKIPIREKNVPE